MLKRAQQILARQRNHFAHIEMEILAALGDGGIESPDRGIGGEKPEACAIAPVGIDERVEQSLGRCKHTADEGSATHRFVTSDS